jgi:hypothetical protein
MAANTAARTKEASILEVGGNLAGRGVDFLVPMFYILPF